MFMSNARNSSCKRPHASPYNALWRSRVMQYVILLAFAACGVLCMPCAHAQYSIRKLTNGSGGTIAANRAVILDTAADSSFTTTTTERDDAFIGITAESVTDGAVGTLVIDGVYDIYCSGAVARGDYIITSTDAGVSKSGGTTNNANAYAYALEAGTDANITCYVFGIVPTAESGAVSGPGSSTDNAIARFDGVTGIVLQDYTSGAPTVSDTGTMTLVQPLVIDDSSLQVQEGVDTMTITVPTLTAARAVTLPDAAGEISLLGQTISLAAEVTGNLPVTNLNSGTNASSSTYWRGDGAWVAPPGGGDVTGPASSVDNTLVRFDSTTGKVIQSYTSGAPSASDTGTLTLVQPLVVDDTSIQIQEGADTMTITVPALTAARAVTFPDAAGEISLLGQTVDLSSEITGNLPVANLNSGTNASSSTYWRGDGTWVAPAGSGDVTGPASSVDNAFVRFDSTTGKILQDYTSGAPTASDTGTVTLVQPLVVDDTSIQVQEGVDTLTLTVPALSAARAVTFPDAAGEISLLGQTIASSEIANNEIIYSDMATLSTDPNDDQIVFFDDSATGFVYLDPDAEALLVTATSLGFTYSAASGDVGFAANEAAFAVNGLIFEGATADAIEARIQVADPASADVTYTFPAETGHVSVKTPIVLTAAGCIPATTNGCVDPALDANDNMVAEFAASDNGFWQFAIPDDYDGSVENVRIYWYKGDTNAVTWTVGSVLLADNEAMNTAYTAGSSSADTTPAANNLEVTSITDTDILGASTASAGEYVKLRLTSNAFTGTSAFLVAIYIEY